MITLCYVFLDYGFSFLVKLYALLVFSENI